MPSLHENWTIGTPKTEYLFSFCDRSCFVWTQALRLASTFCGTVLSHSAESSISNTSVHRAMFNRAHNCDSACQQLREACWKRLVEACFDRPLAMGQSSKVHALCLVINLIGCIVSAMGESIRLQQLLCPSLAGLYQ